MESWGSDANGNTIAEQEKAYTDGRESSNMSISGRIGGSSLKVYKYDAFNRLIQYNDSVSEATYTYGADNLRASKTVNGVKTDFVWNGQNLAGETKNSITTAYTYDPTGIALYRTNGETTRYIKDAHGNVVATTRNNSIAGEYGYTAFGVQLNSTDTSNPFRYCGEYLDNESGLVYLRNRYYNSATGRFITEDPVKDGLNWYSYCAGEPVMSIDPSGLYNRYAAVEYALKYSKNSPNTRDYRYTPPDVRFGQDCTNFVSFCLFYGGGMSQSDDWFYDWAITWGDRAIGYYSATWTVSNEQYEIFTNRSGQYTNRYSYGENICIHESRWIADAIRNYNIQPGDLLYFLNPDTNEMGHTSIIVSTDNGRITYAQHDDDKRDGDLGYYLDKNVNDPKAYTYVFVVKIRDDA